MSANAFATLLADSQRSGLYALPARRRLVLGNTTHAPSVRRLQANLSTCATSAAALEELGRALAFPEYYGANFDALSDCLSDPDWQPASGHVIFIDGLATLRNGDPEGFATLIEVLQGVADQRRESGHPFWLLLDIPARGVPTLPSA